MTDEIKDVKQEDETSSGESTEQKGSEESIDSVEDDVKVPDTKKAEDLIDKKEVEMTDEDGNVIGTIDRKRFNELNDQAKLYKAFAPVIDGVKDNPNLVADILGTKEKGSLEDRVAQMEENQKENKRKELTGAVAGAISRFEGFEEDWPEIKEQVDMMIKRGIPADDAIRRSYIALHPEKAEEESKRIAQENANATGQFQSPSGRTPNIIDTKEDPNLTDGEKSVAQHLLGKSYGNDFVPINSQEDYAKLLKKHETHLRSTGFYDIP